MKHSTSRQIPLLAGGYGDGATGTIMASTWQRHGFVQGAEE